MLKCLFNGETSGPFYDGMEHISERLYNEMDCFVRLFVGLFCNERRSFRVFGIIVTDVITQAETDDCSHNPDIMI